MFNLLKLLTSYSTCYFRKLEKVEVKKKTAMIDKRLKDAATLLTKRNKEVLRAAFILDRFPTSKIIIKLQPITFKSAKYHLERLRKLGFIHKEKHKIDEETYWHVNREQIERSGVLD